MRSAGRAPDFNADEAIWARAREEVTANTCPGTKATVQEALAHSLDGLAEWTAEVQSRCRRELQALADAPPAPSPESHREVLHGDPIDASVQRRPSST